MYESQSTRPSSQTPSLTPFAPSSAGDNGQDVLDFLDNDVDEPWDEESLYKYAHEQLDAEDAGVLHDIREFHSMFRIHYSRFKTSIHRSSRTYRKRARQYPCLSPTFPREHTQAGLQRDAPILRPQDQAQL